jgi:hypothetical protein
MDSKRVNVFVQVNTIKGNRYLDDCGKIMNAFDEEFPTKGVQADNFSSNTLVMVNAEARLRQVKVTTQVIWLYFDTPDTNQYVIDHSTRVIEGICDTIGVTQFNRIAVRSQYIIFDSDFRSLVRRARTWSFSPALATAMGSSERLGDDSEGFQLIYPVISGDMVVNFQLGAAQMEEESREPPLPKEGLLLDSDVYRNGRFSLAEFRRFARVATSWPGEKTSAIILALTGVD